MNPLRAAALLAPWLLYLLLVDLVLSLLLPLSRLAPDLVYHAASALAASVWAWIQAIFTRLNHAPLAVSPPALPLRESAIVVANHVAWADFYMIQEAARRARMLGRCRWLAKRELRWVPFLGWGLWAMGMPLVSRKWATDRAELEKVFRGIVSKRWPVWLIAYSEGSRYTPARYAAAVEFCKTHNKPVPRHTLSPRPRGFIATVDSLRRAPHVRAVYDMTIAYAHGNAFMKAPAFWETITTPDLVAAGYRFFVHVERYELSELPTTDEDLAAWLEKRWVEKGERLEALREKLARGEAWGGDAVTE